MKVKELKELLENLDEDKEIGYYDVEMGGKIKITYIVKEDNEYIIS